MKLPSTHRAAQFSLQQFILALFSWTMGFCSCAPDRAQQSFLSFNGKAATFIRRVREFQPLEPKGEAEGIPFLLISGICDEAPLQTAGTITPHWVLNCDLFLISKSSSLKPKRFSVGWMVNICCLLSWGQQLVYSHTKLQSQVGCGQLRK